MITVAFATEIYLYATSPNQYQRNASPTAILK